MSLSSLIEGDIYGHATYIEKSNEQKNKTKQKVRVGKVIKAHTSQSPKRPELIPVSVA